MSVTGASCLHRAASPITSAEFRDAVLSICPPRFPTARYARPQRICLAVSGGVDSMALAFLFSRMLKMERTVRIADYPIVGAYGIVVDHRLRQGSDVEAANVARALHHMGIRPHVQAITWREEKKLGIDPASLSNLESAARIMRYQVLGSACYQRSANSLFFAHHADDQYETVLMRLISGHGYRGLRGMQSANAIPECYDMSGVYKSGLLDDQARRYPSLSFKPTNRELQRLRRIFREEDMGMQSWELLTAKLAKTQGPGLMPQDPDQPYVRPLPVEDGGVMIYRPLLHFDKDRLIATCEANNVPWFEDATNADPSLTARNAIRHIVRDHTLPKALQKDSILRMSERANKRADEEDAEARRLIHREAVIRSFDTNAGTLRIRLPALSIGRQRHEMSATRRDRLRAKQRVIAAVMLRKLIGFVTPDRHHAPLSSLESIVRRLYPALYQEPTTERKAFTFAGVLLEPLPNRRWLLSRAPYPASKPLPSCRMLNRRSRNPTVPPLSELSARQQQHVKWRTCKHHQLWDNRFWIRLATTLPSATFRVLPFHPSHSKPFLRALPAEDRKRVEKVLRVYAPGKVRFSLPGLYAVEDASQGISKSQPGLDTEIDADEAAARRGTLVALPSLGVHVAGLERWVRYDVRYRHVDADLLQASRKPSRVQGKALDSLGWRRRRSRRRG